VKSFAFYGRVSSDDAQDPSLSIPRQLSACERAVAASGGEIVCCYWDVESGRKALEDRGQGSSAWCGRVAVPCAGGLPELLAAAYHGEPRPGQHKRRQGSTGYLPDPAHQTRRPCLCLARPSALRTMRTTDGGHPPEGLQLLPLPRERHSREQRRSRHRTPRRIADQGGHRPRRRAQVHGQPAIRTRAAGAPP
jgi:Resolvase, N terminal domain